MIWIVVALAAWVGGWYLNIRLSNGGAARSRAGRLAVPLVFGLTVLVLWEGLVRGLQVSPVILPNARIRSWMPFAGMCVPM